MQIVLIFIIGMLIVDYVDNHITPDEPTIEATE